MTTANASTESAVASIFFRHWNIGWAIHDADNDEGAEGVFPSESEAETYRSDHWDPEEHEDVDIYPVAYQRKNDGDELRFVLLTHEEFEALLPYRPEPSNG